VPEKNRYEGCVFLRKLETTIQKSASNRLNTTYATTLHYNCTDHFTTLQVLSTTTDRHASDELPKTEKCSTKLVTTRLLHSSHNIKQYHELQTNRKVHQKTCHHRTVHLRTTNKLFSQNHYRHTSYELPKTENREAPQSLSLLTTPFPTTTRLFLSSTTSTHDKHSSYKTETCHIHVFFFFPTGPPIYNRNSSDELQKLEHRDENSITQKGYKRKAISQRVQTQNR
jgi:hypothetical protein